MNRVSAPCRRVDQIDCPPSLNASGAARRCPRSKNVQTASPARNPSHPHRRPPFPHVGGHVEPGELSISLLLLPSPWFAWAVHGLISTITFAVTTLPSSHVRTSLHILDLLHLTWSALRDCTVLMSRLPLSTRPSP